MLGVGQSDEIRELGFKCGWIALYGSLWGVRLERRS
jgi:hypothetical protein